MLSPPVVRAGVARTPVNGSPFNTSRSLTASVSINARQHSPILPPIQASPSSAGQNNNNNTSAPHVNTSNTTSNTSSASQSPKELLQMHNLGTQPPSPSFIEREGETPSHMDEQNRKSSILPQALVKVFQSKNAVQPFNPLQQHGRERSSTLKHRLPYFNSIHSEFGLHMSMWSLRFLDPRHEQQYAEWLKQRVDLWYILHTVLLLILTTMAIIVEVVTMKEDSSDTQGLYEQRIGLLLVPWCGSACLLGWRHLYTPFAVREQLVLLIVYSIAGSCWVVGSLLHTDVLPWTNDPGRIIVLLTLSTMNTGVSLHQNNTYTDKENPACLMQTHFLGCVSLPMPLMFQTLLFLPVVGSTLLITLTYIITVALIPIPTQSSASLAYNISLLLLTLLGSSLLCYRKDFHSRSFYIAQLKNNKLRVEKAALDHDTKNLKSEFFAMTLERFDIADIAVEHNNTAMGQEGTGGEATGRHSVAMDMYYGGSAGTTKSSIINEKMKSPMEQVMIKLQMLGKNKELPSAVLKEIMKVITMLGSNSGELFKAKLDDRMHMGIGGEGNNHSVYGDDEMTRYIYETLNGEINGVGTTTSANNSINNAAALSSPQQQQHVRTLTMSVNSRGSGVSVNNAQTSQSSAGGGLVAPNADNMSTINEEHSHTHHTHAQSHPMLHSTQTLLHLNSPLSPSSTFSGPAGISSTSTLTSPTNQLSNSREERNLHDVIHQLDDWNLDIFEVATLTGGRPLFFIGMALLKKYHCIQKFALDTAKLTNFLNGLEAGYSKNNPYHNSAHAADVARNVHWFILCGHMTSYCTDLEIFSLILAALAHDFQHPGKNNAFCIASRDEKALLYNDRSILENYHVAQTFLMLHNPAMSCNILSGFSVKDYSTLRKLVVDFILATDLAHSQEFLARFKNWLTAAEAEVAMAENAVNGVEVTQASTVGNTGTNTTQGVNSMGAASVNTVSVSTLSGLSSSPPSWYSQSLSFLCAAKLKEVDARVMMMKMALKCSDLGHAAKHLSLHEKWTSRITEEFYRQGDEERKLGLPVSPFMDRRRTNLSQAQIGFLDWVVSPLFTAWFRYIDPLDKRQLELWAREAEAEAANSASSGLVSKINQQQPDRVTVMEQLRRNREHWRTWQGKGMELIATAAANEQKEKEKRKAEAAALEEKKANTPRQTTAGAGTAATGTEATALHPPVLDEH